MFKINNGVLTIKESHDKIRITLGSKSYTSSLFGTTTLPLPYGDGRYTFELFDSIGGNRYKRAYTKTINVKNTSNYMLQPNTYVPVTDAWVFAQSLCEGLDEKTSFQTICKWIRNNIVYDYIRMATVAKTGVLPDPDLCWRTHKGICQDIASLAAGMMRAVSIKARLVCGKADGQSHAWVEATVGDKNYRFDFPKKASTYTRERTY